MAVSKRKNFSNQSSGASVLEVVLAMAIVALATPFVYNQIAQTTHSMHDISVARRVMSTRDAALNFVRMNQDRWPDVAQIKLDETELVAISPDAVAGIIDKYTVNGATITDIYLAFTVADNQLRTNKIARHIGVDAAVIGPDSIAYGNTWAVSAPDFNPGDLVYRISRDINGMDTSKYLHRATSGEDELNVMFRDLDMAHHHTYNVATVLAKSARIQDVNATFLDTPDMVSQSVYFTSGANVDNADISLGDVRVSGDMSGFKNVYADNLNGSRYTTTGRIITDRATITNSINVANDFIIKSDSSHTIDGFTGISVNSVVAPFISAEQMVFYENFGLTISGELLMSTTSPVQLGRWVFPSTRPPYFSSFTLSRAEMPGMPSRNSFSDLYRSGWQNVPSATPQPITPKYNGFNR